MSLRIPGGLYVSANAGDVTVMMHEMNNPVGVQTYSTGLVNWNCWEGGRTYDGHLWFSLPLYALFIFFALPTVFLWYRDRRPPPGHCATCGYDLTGNVSGRCPECGELI